MRTLLAEILQQHFQNDSKRSLLVERNFLCNIAVDIAQEYCRRIFTRTKILLQEVLRKFLDA